MKATKIRILEDCGKTNELSAEISDIETLQGDSKTRDLIRLSIQQIEFLAYSGNLTRAEEVAENLKEYINSYNYNLAAYWYSKGFIEFSKNNLDNAEQWFLKATREYDDYLILYMLSQTQIKLGKYNEASINLKKLLHECYLFHPIWSLKRIKANYYLGLAYELDGKIRDAIEQYTKILELYENADKEIAEIGKARERLMKLRNQL
jgi:tetratricopeptide (TPR) repeat protein